MKDFKQWDGFAGRLWKEGVDVRDFIQNNYTPYDGDDSFLEGPTEALSVTSHDIDRTDRTAVRDPDPYL